MMREEREGGREKREGMERARGGEFKGEKRIYLKLLISTLLRQQSVRAAHCVHVMM
jgi:hypothetical protein